VDVGCCVTLILGVQARETFELFDDSAGRFGQGRLSGGLGQGGEAGIAAQLLGGPNGGCKVLKLPILSVKRGWRTLVVNDL